MSPGVAAEAEAEVEAEEALEGRGHVSEDPQSKA